MPLSIGGIISLILAIHKKIALWLFLYVILALCVVARKKKTEQQNRRKTHSLAYCQHYYPRETAAWQS
jgi:preprotein translocase subunit SecG